MDFKPKLLGWTNLPASEFQGISQFGFSISSPTFFSQTLFPILHNLWTVTRFLKIILQAYALLCLKQKYSSLYTFMPSKILKFRAAGELISRLSAAEAKLEGKLKPKSKRQLVNGIYCFFVQTMARAQVTLGGSCGRDIVLWALLPQTTRWTKENPKNLIFPLPGGSSEALGGFERWCFLL